MKLFHRLIKWVISSWFTSSLVHIVHILLQSYLQVICVFSYNFYPFSLMMYIASFDSEIEQKIKPYVKFNWK